MGREVAVGRMHRAKYSRRDAGDFPPLICRVFLGTQWKPAAKRSYLARFGIRNCSSRAQHVPVV